MDEGRKMELGRAGSPTLPFSFLPSLHHFLMLSPTLAFFPSLQFPLPFFSIQSGSQDTSSETKALSLQSSLGGCLVPSNNFLWHNPNHTIFRSIREFLFWVSCCLFGFVKGSCLTGAHIFIQLFLLPKCAIKGQ